MSLFRKVIYDQNTPKYLLIFSELQTVKIVFWGFRSILNEIQLSQVIILEDSTQARHLTILQRHTLCALALKNVVNSCVEKEHPFMRKVKGNIRYSREPASADIPICWLLRR